MTPRTTITKDESNILVAIGKLATQMDGLRTDIASARGEIEKINTGITARILNLESNSVSKLEINPKLDEYENRITNLEDSRIEYRATIKAWVIMATIANIVFGFALQAYFYFH
jgi:chromosome segregation ATPase